MGYVRVPVTEAVGMVIPHDLTEIVKGEKKGPAFRKGHVISHEDIPILQRIGKNHIYVLTLGKDELHEDDASLLLARAIAGPNIEFDGKPSEGKVGFRATCDGLLSVDEERLFAFNMLGEVMLATLHSGFHVRKGTQVAAGRPIPLVISRAVVEKAASIASEGGGLVRVAPFTVKTGGIIVTGQEVFEGRIKDAFGPVIAEKLGKCRVDVLSLLHAPDDADAIARAIRQVLALGAQIVICTGGMSVDPDDVTRTAISMAGARDVVYGSPVLPGAMFLVGYLPGDVPVLGVPACGMFFKTTVFDLVLPRVLADERLNREKIAALGHGGLCLGCLTCSYPVCPFGKG